MKIFFSVAIGVLIFLGGCYLDYCFVNWLTTAIETPKEYQFVVKLLLLLFTCTATIILSVIAAIFGGMLVDAWISDLISNSRRKNLQKRK